MNRFRRLLARLGRRGTAGAVLLLLGLAGVGAGPILDGAPSHSVHVRWSPDAGEAERQALERRHGLRLLHQEDRTFAYDIVNESRGNIKALILNPLVEDTHDLVRGTFRVADTAALGRARNGVAWWWGVEGYLPFVRAGAALATGLGLVLLLMSGPFASGHAWRLRMESYLPRLPFAAAVRRAGSHVATFLRSVAAEARTPAFAVSRVTFAAGALTVVVFLGTVALRWAATKGLGGDDHWSLWTSATFLAGDRPFREFADPGDPLYWAMSAFAQWLVGYRAIGEVGLGLLLMGGAMAVSFRMSWRSGGALSVAFALAVLAVLLVTPVKLYSYPKVFLYPLGVWSAWRYIDKPGLLRGALLAFAVAVAFGYRHDHGAYLSVGAAAAVLAAHWKDGPRGAILPLVRVGALTILILSPYFAMVQAHEGIVGYFRERIRFAAQTDAAGRRAVPFVVDRSAALFFSIPPPEPARLGVSWKPGIPEPVRAALEQQYRLEKPEAPSEGGYFRYFMVDYSDPNITALLADAMVTSVDGLEGSYRLGYVPDEAPDGTRVPVTVGWRAGVPPAAVADLELKHRLTRRLKQPPGETAIEYDIDDPSVDNLTALRQDPAVASIRGIHFARVPVRFRLLERVPGGPPLHVQWAPAVTPGERAALETRFSLKAGTPDPRDPQGTSWLYEAGDTSAANVTALVAHPAAASVTGAVSAGSPPTYTVRPWTPPPGAQISVAWSPALPEPQRRVLEERYTLIPDHGHANDATIYRMRDAVPAEIRALGAEPWVARLNGANTATGRVDGESWFEMISRRLPVLRVVPLPRLFLRENAGVWLYYVAFLIPAVVLGVLAWDWWSGGRVDVMPAEGQKMFAVAVLMSVANLALLRKLGYFPDHFDVTIIMGAWLLGRALRADRRRLIGIAVTLVAGLGTGVSVLAVSTYVDLPTFANRYGLFSSPDSNPLLTSERARQFSTRPPIDFYAPKDSKGDKALIRFLYECTKPEDRIFVTSDVYTIPYYTQRRVVGHVFWANGFMANPAFEDRMIALMERDPVPFVFGVGGERPLDNLSFHPRVRDYVDRRFTERHAILQDSLTGRVLWLFVDGRRTPVRTYEQLGLPCFR